MFSQPFGAISLLLTQAGIFSWDQYHQNVSRPIIIKGNSTFQLLVSLSCASGTNFIFGTFLLLECDDMVYASCQRFLNKVNIQWFLSMNLLCIFKSMSSTHHALTVIGNFPGGMYFITKIKTIIVKFTYIKNL